MAQPGITNTGKAPNAVALASLRNEGKCDVDVEQRQAKYLHNSAEADHGTLNQFIRPGARFQNDPERLGHHQGLEVMQTPRKRQGRSFSFSSSQIDETRILERAPGSDPCAISEALPNLEIHLLA